MNRYVVDVQVIVAREFMQRLGLKPAEYVELDKACFLGDYIARKINLFENKTADEIYQIAVEYVQNYDPNAPEEVYTEIIEDYNSQLQHIAEAHNTEQETSEQPSWQSADTKTTEEKEQSKQSEQSKQLEDNKATDASSSSQTKVTPDILNSKKNDDDVPIIEKVANNLRPEKKLKVPEGSENLSVQQALDKLHKAPQHKMETQILDTTKPTKVGVYKVSKEELEREEKERQARLKAKAEKESNE